MRILTDRNDETEIKQIALSLMPRLTQKMYLQVAFSELRPGISRPGEPPGGRTRSVAGAAEAIECRGISWVSSGVSCQRCCCCQSWPRVIIEIQQAVCWHSQSRFPHRVRFRSTPCARRRRVVRSPVFGPVSNHAIDCGAGWLYRLSPVSVTGFFRESIRMAHHEMDSGVLSLLGV